MKNTFYVTSPIYYPNDVPHLGHAYTNLACDVLARWNRLKGKDVFFLTGTDEHGKKIAETADKKGIPPKKFVDELIPEFKKAWKTLDINYDHFIRTTDKEHETVVREILEKVHKNGDIYKGTYEGYYCTGCEAYYTEKDAIDLHCPIHGKKLELLKEESYFFKLSKYEKFLLEFYKKNPNFISPQHRKNEIVNRIKEGLKDFSISRTSFDWGIKLPFDEKHVCYVWFDALLNYYSATKKKGLDKYWPADLHIIGKDILWFHSVYWPAMLKSAGLELPKRVFAHGWWTVNSQKMGKSAGNAISVDKLVSIAGLDSARYFLLRETSFGEDGDFSQESLIQRHNDELGNKLGNLVSRLSTLAEKYGLENKTNSLFTKGILDDVDNHLDNLEFDKALQVIMHLIDKINEYLQENKPWETKDAKTLYVASDSLKNATILLSSFIPETCNKIKEVNFFVQLFEREVKLFVVFKIK